MRTTFRDELEVFYRMSGVFIQMLMYDAEKNNSSIRADVNFMENYKALQDMKDFEELVMNQDFTLTKKPAANAQLPAQSAPPQVERVVVQDQSTIEENKQLQKQVTQLQSQIENAGSSAQSEEQNAQLQRQLTEAQE